jgi:hypothetical protein
MRLLGTLERYGLALRSTIEDDHHLVEYQAYIIHGSTHVVIDSDSGA